jgi:tripartite ATP-independent transporter DctM subunit
MTTLVLFLVFVVLFSMRASVTTSMGIACLVALIVGDYPLSQIPRYMSSGIESFVLLAVPFFILVGNLLNVGGATERIFEFSKAVFGRIPGSLAQVNIGASMIFAGMSGAALADAAGLGTIEMKVMRKAGYRPAFAAAVTLASSMVGPIIPPSIVMVVYSATTGVSTGRMFIAGIVPGVLTGLILMAYVYYLARSGREACPMTETFSAKRIYKTGKRASLALMAPVIVLGGMVTGLVTPTEAGVLAAFYAFALGLLYQSLNDGKFVAALRQTAVDSAQILYLISISAIMGWIVTIEGTAQDLVGIVSLFADNNYLGLIAINVFLLALGCIIETTAAILICGSLLLPAAQAMGVDPVHFGVILVFNLLVGMMTPPMGVGLYVISSVGGVSAESVVRSIFPFFIPILAALLIITFVPELSLWLPRLVFGS